MDTPSAITAFLYLLMRDMVVPGEVEGLVEQLEKASGPPFDLSNEGLGQYAHEVAVRLAEIR